MCKHGNVFSLAVLIGRGLDHNPSWFKIALSSPILLLLLPLFSFQGMFSEEIMCFAPLAQLVEHLTLNQGVPGSSP